MEGIFVAIYIELEERAIVYVARDFFLAIIIVFSFYMYVIIIRRFLERNFFVWLGNKFFGVR